MADNFVDTPVEEAANRNELVAAIILGIAAVLTAVASFNAGAKSGDALVAYTQSTKELNDANFFFSQANQTFAADQQIFIAYAAAVQQGDDDLATYLTTLMRPELAEAVAFAEDPETEAITPFDEVEGNPYTLDDLDEANARQEAADGLFDQGSEDDDAGGVFDLATVLFAITLFFGGIANLFHPVAIKTGLLVVAALLLAVGLVVLVSAFSS